MRGSFDGADPTTLTIPKLMLLTVADPPIDHYELCVDVDDFSPIDGWLRTDDSVLDGVYIRFQSEMLESDGTAHLKALCNKYPVGVWGMNGKDPDDYKTMEFLVKECGVSFFNTDLPRGSLGQDDLQMTIENSITSHTYSTREMTLSLQLLILNCDDSFSSAK